MLESAKKTKIDIHEYWQLFWRRKFFFIIPLLISLIIGVVYCFTSKPMYQSLTVVQLSQSQLLSSAMKRLIPGTTNQERLENLRKLITSQAYLRRLIETLELYKEPKIREIAEKEKDQYPGLTVDEITELLWIEQLRGLLTIRQSGTDFVQITALGTTPELAFNLAKTLTQIFIDESLRNEVGGIRGALEFSSEQLAIYKKKLEESEERLKKFKEDVVYDEFENHSTISENLDQVEAMLVSVNIELREAKNRLLFYQSQVKNSNISYDPPNNNILNGLKYRLLEASQELAQFMLKYSWQDVRIMKINSEIEDILEKIQNEIEKEIKIKYPAINSSTHNLFLNKEITQINVSFLEEKKNSISNSLNKYKRSVSEGPSREMILNRLTREVNHNREIYQTLLQQTQGSEIEEALQKTAAEFKFKIVEPAIKPVKPVKPNRVKMMLMAAVLGSFIGIGLIFFLESSDHSFKNIEEVEQYLDLPVLGTLPKIEFEQVKNY